MNKQKPFLMILSTYDVLDNLYDYIQNHYCSFPKQNKISKKILQLFYENYLNNISLSDQKNKVIYTIYQIKSNNHNFFFNIKSDSLHNFVL